MCNSSKLTNSIRNYVKYVCTDWPQKSWEQICSIGAYLVLAWLFWKFRPYLASTWAHLKAQKYMPNGVKIIIKTDNYILQIYSNKNKIQK